MTEGGETVSESTSPDSVFKTIGPDEDPKCQMLVARPMYCMPAGTAPASVRPMWQFATPAQPELTEVNWATP